ncbi:MAG TPA: ankyrin repeat domain-containing protein [Terriglobales bacterium]|nr:ankyrin repeat domain-containing protein [Terriglobales bacterium]
MANEVIEAVKSGERSRVENAIEAHPALAASLDDNGVSALLIAVYYGQREIADLLASRVSTMSMHEGAAIGDLTTIRALGRWPDTVRDYSPDGWTPLHLAAAFGGAEAVRVLLELAADPNQRSRNALNNTPLHACAAISRSVDIARMLLDHGADVNATQHGGFTALHSAAFNGSVDLVGLLVERGADLSARTDDGQTAADLAREKGHDKLAILLSP